MAANYDLSRIDKMEGHEFERFVASLLRKLNYQKVEVTPGSSDQGVDVLAEKDGVRYAIQCKCYSSDLGNTPIQEVNTGKVIYHCHVGVVVTNRYFTQGAQEAAKATGVLLWDRTKLEQLIAQVEMGSDAEPAGQQNEGSLTLWTGSPLLRRGGIALKDREWKKASQFFDRVLNTDPENAEAYLGLVLAEAELSNEDGLVYIDQTKFFRLNWNNLRHAKEFAGPELSAWFDSLDVRRQKYQSEIAAEAETTRDSKKFEPARQNCNLEYMQLILSFLSENPELIVTAADVMEKILRPAYPSMLWSIQKSASLLNSMSDKHNISGELISKCVLTRIATKGDRTRYTLNKDVSEAERERWYEEAVLRVEEEFRPAETLTLAQIENEKYKHDILYYLAARPSLMVTPTEAMNTILRPAYPDRLWSESKVAALLKALVSEGKLICVENQWGVTSYMLNKDTCQKEIFNQRETALQITQAAQDALKSEQVTLQEELSNLRGLFTGNRRRKIETRLKEIKQELAELTTS